MIDPRRTPSNDDLAELDDTPTPSQGGSSGGDLQREIGALDEEKLATGADPQPTSVHKGQKPRDGADEDPTARYPRRTGRAPAQEDR